MIRSVLFFGAHPDDETMLTGATLALLARRGAAVHIAIATRGEGGEMGEPPVVEAREKLAAVREAELRCAAAALGAASVDVLAYVDPLVGEGDALYPFAADYAALVGQVGALIAQHRADVVLTHGADGEYGHPGHQLVHRAVVDAVDHMDGTAPLLYTVCAQVPGIEDHIWNASESAHLALDVTPWLDLKEQAALCHASQHALFKRRRSLKTVRDALRTIEAVHRQRPPVAPGDAPDDAFAALLLEAGAWRPDDEVTT